MDALRRADQVTSPGSSSISKAGPTCRKLLCIAPYQLRPDHIAIRKVSAKEKNRVNHVANLKSSRVLLISKTILAWERNVDKQSEKNGYGVWVLGCLVVKNVRFGICKPSCPSHSPSLADSDSVHLGLWNASAFLTARSIDLLL